MESRDFASDDSIHIEELKLCVRIGVTAEERSTPQRLTASLTLWPTNDFREVNDRLERTVDYAAVCREVKNLSDSARDQLLETLAEKLAVHLVATFSLRRVRLELRKFILPDVSFVSVTIERP